MYESKELALIKELIDKCQDQIKQHNEISFRKVKLDLPKLTFSAINYDKKKYTDTLSLNIIKFYEFYCNQSIIVNEIKQIIPTITYAENDLIIKYNRSLTAILEIYEQLKEITNSVSDIATQLDSIHKSAHTGFVNYIKPLINEQIDIDEVIRLIYKCMEERGQVKKNDYNEKRPFTKIGPLIIELLYNANLINDSATKLIIDLNKKLKYKILNIDESELIQYKKNKYQKFGAVPDEGENQNLKPIIKKLFGVDIHDFESIYDAVEPLTNMLKQIENETGESKGIIVHLSRNEDNYFDISPLYNQTKSYGSSGVSTQMIKSFDLVKQGNPTTIKSFDTLFISIDPSKIKQAYVLWTHDLKTFKFKSEPIDSYRVINLLRRSPSPTVNEFNKRMGEVITKRLAEGTTMADYHKVKYMAFTDNITEESFLNKLCGLLIEHILKTLAKVDPSKMESFVKNRSFSEQLYEIIDAERHHLGIPPRLYFDDWQMTYETITFQIISKLKKAIIKNPIIEKANIKDIVKSTIIINKNIYTRTISLYFLELAGRQKKHEDYIYPTILDKESFYK